MLLSDCFYILVTVSSSNLKARFDVENVFMVESSFLLDYITFSRAISSSFLKLAVSLSCASICCWIIWIRFVDSFYLVGDFDGEFDEEFVGLPASSNISQPVHVEGTLVDACNYLISFSAYSAAVNGTDSSGCSNGRIWIVWSGVTS
jgi:hypothetical protein